LPIIDQHQLSAPYIFTDLQCTGEHVTGFLLHAASNVDEWWVSLLEWYMSDIGAKLFMDDIN